LAILYLNDSFITIASWDLNNITVNYRYTTINYYSALLNINNSFSIINPNYEYFITSAFTTVNITTAYSIPRSYPNNTG